MPRFNISIVLLKQNNAPGAQFNVQVDADDYLTAMDAGKVELQNVLKESGLTVVSPSTDGEKKVVPAN